MHFEIQLLGLDHLRRNQPPRSTQPSHSFVGGRDEYEQKLGRKHIGTPRDALPSYPWFCGVNWRLVKH